MKIDGKHIDYINLEGGYSSLFRYPKRVAPSYSNYAERDGIKPDLRKVLYESKKVEIPFFIPHRTKEEFWNKYNSIFNQISAPGYRKIKVEGKEFTLRYASTPKFDLFNAKAGTIFSFQLIEDKHNIEKIDLPIGTPVNPRGYFSINGIDFAEFGITPQGEIGDVLKYPDVKEPFYDHSKRELYQGIKTLKHKQITIKLVQRAANKDQFFHNHASFFSQFSTTGKQPLYISEIDGTTEVYYLDCPSYTVHWVSPIWVEFSITLMIPVVTWMSGQSEILKVLYFRGLKKVLAFNNKVVAFNNRSNGI